MTVAVTADRGGMLTMTQYVASSVGARALSWKLIAVLREIEVHSGICSRLRAGLLASGGYTTAGSCAGCRLCHLTKTLPGQLGGRLYHPLPSSPDDQTEAQRDKTAHPGLPRTWSWGLTQPPRTPEKDTEQLGYHAGWWLSKCGLYLKFPLPGLTPHPRPMPGLQQRARGFVLTSSPGENCILDHTSGRGEGRGLAVQKQNAQHTQLLNAGSPCSCQAVHCTRVPYPRGTFHTEHLIHLFIMAVLRQMAVRCHGNKISILQ